MANERGKAIDNTHLSIDQAEERGFIHRDYIAHCLRWSHVVKALGKKPEQWDVLDVGCGREVPLARTLYTGRLIVNSYVGVDYNELGTPEMFKTGKFPLRLIGGIDAANLERVDDTVRLGPAAFPLPNVIVSFEMIEHVEPGHCRKILQRLYSLMGPTTVLFLSTPCYDEGTGAAANHVNEMTYKALGACLEDLGFTVSSVFGTFASLSDYEPLVRIKYGEKGALLFNQLRDYYDVNYLSTVFAPLFPAQSRNCLWRVTVQPGTTRKFPRLVEVPGPWSSSKKWKELNGDPA